MNAISIIQEDHEVPQLIGAMRWYKTAAGEKVLQQAWNVATYNQFGQQVAARQEWREVPIEYDPALVGH